MKDSRILKFLLPAILVAATILYFLPQYQRQLSLENPSPQASLKEIANIPAQAPLTLITEPSDGVAPALQAINGAHTSIDLVTYELEDTTIEQALLSAKNRGIHVRVLLDHSSHFGKTPNDAAFAFLQSKGVPVEWAKNYFPITHQKTLVVDNTSALLMTFNFAPQYYNSSRDFGILDDDQVDIAAIEQTFNSDWSGTEELAQNGDDLVWSPNSAQTLLSLIHAASSSLDIYNEEMADTRVTQALEDATKRGVHVRVDMTYGTQWKQALQELSDAGVEVRTYASTASLYIHAKVIVADGARAFVGSENFSAQSLDQNRELGILISRQDIISSIEKTFAADWAGSRPFQPTTQNAAAPADGTIIKLSSSGICHAPGDSSYARTKKFTSYASLQDCLNAGGRMPLFKEVQP